MLTLLPGLHVFSKVRTLPLIFAVSTTAACTHADPNSPGGGQMTNEMVKQASPNPGSARGIDCIGENQTTAGTTRADCLPNEGDEAARDTTQGSGGRD